MVPRGRLNLAEQVVQRAEQYGYEGVEVDGKRPHGNPRRLAARPRISFDGALNAPPGARTYAVANNDFSSPVPGAPRVPERADVRDLIRMTGGTSAKGAAFLAWPGAAAAQGGGRYDLAKAVWQINAPDVLAGETWRCREAVERLVAL